MLDDDYEFPEDSAIYSDIKDDDAEQQQKVVEQSAMKKQQQPIETKTADKQPGSIKTIEHDSAGGGAFEEFSIDDDSMSKEAAAVEKPKRAGLGGLPQLNNNKSASLGIDKILVDQQQQQKREEEEDEEEYSMAVDDQEIEADNDELQFDLNDEDEDVVEEKVVEEHKDSGGLLQEVTQPRQSPFELQNLYNSQIQSTEMGTRKNTATAESGEENFNGERNDSQSQIMDTAAIDEVQEQQVANSNNAHAALLHIKNEQVNQPSLHDEKQFEEEEVPEETISDQETKPLMVQQVSKKDQKSVMKSPIPSIISSKKPSTLAQQFEPINKDSNKDEKGKSQMDDYKSNKFLFQADEQNQPVAVTSSEEPTNSKQAPNAAASSIVDEVPESAMSVIQKQEIKQQNTDSSQFFSAHKIHHKNPQAGMTSHSAMMNNNNGIMKPSKNLMPPKNIGVKSQLNSIDSISNGAGGGLLGAHLQYTTAGLLAKPGDAQAPAVGEKKFSLVPFAKAKSSSAYSSAPSEATSMTQIVQGQQNNQNNKNRMELIHETPEEVAKITKDLAPVPNVAAVENGDDDDDDDDYEDDNDFEPFETSKKDFYQADSQSEAKSQHEVLPTSQAQPSNTGLQQMNMHTPAQQKQQLQGVIISQANANQQASQQKPIAETRVSQIKQPTKLFSPMGIAHSGSHKKSPARSSDKQFEGLPDDKWIQVPALEQKFRFVLPSNCHISKTISAALSHAAKIVTTAQKREADGEVSIEFGLHMNDGPIDDSLSAHPQQVPFSPSQVRLAHRHHDCKTSDQELDHFTWKALNLPEDWQPHAQFIYHIIMLREGQRIMHDAMQIIATERVKKEAQNMSMSQRQSVIALVQSKRQQQIGLTTGRKSIMSQNSTKRGNSKDIGKGSVFKSKQEAKLAQLEAKYAKVLQRQEQLQNPFYFQELRAALKQDEQDLRDAKKFHKQLQLDNQGIEMQMMRMQKSLEKNADKGSSTDIGSKEMSSMMTNLDATNQQLFNMKERLDKARSQVENNEDKLTDFDEKHKKLVLVAQNYNVDHHRVKDYINVVKNNKGENVAPDRVQVQAEQKYTQLQEKKAQAQYKKEKIQSRYEELMAKKQELIEKMTTKKGQLHSLINESKELQNQALKMSRTIKQDKEAYLKLGNLQTATTKGQVSLKGWHPDIDSKQSISKVPSRTNINRQSQNQSIDSSQNYQSPDIITNSQKIDSLSGSINELKYFSGGDRVNVANKKTSEAGYEAPNLSPMHDALKHRNKATSSLQNMKKPEPIEQKQEDEEEYSIPEDENDDGESAVQDNKKSNEKPVLLAKEAPSVAIERMDKSEVTSSVAGKSQPLEAGPPTSKQDNKTAQKVSDDDDDDGYSDESFVQNTIPSPKETLEAKKQEVPKNINNLNVDSQSEYSLVTGLTAQAPAMNPAFQPKSTNQTAAINALGTKPAGGLGSKPNFLAKKRKF